MAVARTLLDHFSVIPDPRVARCRKHKLIDIVVITICGMLSGADDFVTIEQFARMREDWFRERLELPSGIPSHDTMRRLFGRLDPVVLQACLLGWLEAVRSALGITASEQTASAAAYLSG